MYDAWLLDVRAPWRSFSTQHDILWSDNLRVYCRPDEHAVKCFPDSRRVSWRVRQASRSMAYWWTHLCFLMWIAFRAPLLAFGQLYGPVWTPAAHTSQPILHRNFFLIPVIQTRILVQEWTWTRAKAWYLPCFMRFWSTRTRVEIWPRL